MAGKKMAKVYLQVASEIVIEISTLIAFIK